MIGGGSKLSRRGKFKNDNGGIAVEWRGLVWHRVAR